jgi:hypothetical protein
MNRGVLIIVVLYTLLSEHHLGKFDRIVLPNVVSQTVVINVAFLFFGKAKQNVVLVLIGQSPEQLQLRALCLFNLIELHT